MAEMALKMNAFDPLTMDEMMAVDGGGRSRAARSAAARVARANRPTAAQVAKAATIGAGICMVGSGICTVVGAATVTAYCIGGSQIAVGIVGIGAGIKS